VYWPDHNQAVELEIGYPFGMMKFGSRLDMYFPKADIVVKVQAGDRVVAGETIVARLTARTALPAPSTATAKDLADPEPSQAVAPPAIGMEAPEAEAKKE